MLRAPSRRTDLKKASVCSPTMLACSAYAWTWRVKRGEIVNLGGLWLKSHRFSRWSEVPGPSSRVRRAASSLRRQSEVPVVASYGATKTITLTMRLDREAHARRGDVVVVDGRDDHLLPPRHREEQRPRRVDGHVDLKCVENQP